MFLCYICIHTFLFIFHYISTFAFTFISSKSSYLLAYHITTRRQHQCIYKIISICNTWNHQKTISTSHLSINNVSRVQNHGSTSPLIACTHEPYQEHIKSLKKALLHIYLSAMPSAITSPCAPVGPWRWTLSSWRWPLWSHHSPTTLCSACLLWLWL